MKNVQVATLLSAAIILSSVSIFPASAAALAVNGSECTITGTERADVIFGTYQSDVICGLGGNDVIYASSGNDIIDAGSGNDKISAGAGHDQVFGGKGIDYIDGGTGINKCVKDLSDRKPKNCISVTSLVRVSKPQSPTESSSQSSSVSTSISATASPSLSQSVSPGASSSSSASYSASSSPSSGGSSSSPSTNNPGAPVAEQVAIAGSYAGGSSAISNNSGSQTNYTTTTSPTPITLDFESGASGLQGFGGDGASVDSHPAGGAAGSTKAVKVTRGTETFAGTIFHSAPSGVNLISSNNKTVSLLFYSPVANQPVLLKLEDASDQNKYVETLATASTAGWQTLSFNFDNPRANTPAFNAATNYRKAVIFYAFGSTTGGGIYYLDQVIFPAITTTQIAVPSTPAPSYVQGSLLWEDNFNGSGGIDSSKWTSRYCGHSAANGGGACHNNEQQFYTPSANRLDGQGNAVITATKVSSLPSGGSCLSWSGSCPFTSGRFDTQGKVSFKYGLIEARIMNPLGGANWPAFWMLGTDITSVGWPGSGEIDIMEGKSASRVSGAIHWSNNGNDAYEYGEAAGGNYANAYHIYQIHWLENYIAIYVDGVKILEETNTSLNQSGAWAFNHPFFIILNNAISPAGGFSDAYDGWTSSQMKIDYVRHYQLNGQGQVFNN